MNDIYSNNLQVCKVDYVFDSCGLYVYKGFLDSGQVRLARRCFNCLEFVPDSWALEQYRASHIHKTANFLGELNHVIQTHPITSRLISYPLRLIESYALERRVGTLDLHGGLSEYLSGISEIRDISARSWVQEGRIYSLRVKVLIYLDDVKHHSAGRFTYMEGSHKAAFSFHRAFPEGRKGATTLMRTVNVSVGDAIWLNEALLHGAEFKTSQRRRRLLAYTYGPSFMSDWVELDGSSSTSTGYFATETEQT